MIAAGNLEAKTILVTGASSGFGRAIALACAGAGAQVALVARRQTELEAVASRIHDSGGRVAVCPADVADEQQITAAVMQAQAELGPIEVLVNNAGTNVKQRGIRETRPDQWAQLLAVNLTSAYLFTRLLLPDMIARGHGTIINVSSISGLRPNGRAGVGYSASKMGLDALTHVSNEEGNPYGVRACLICPGDGNTPLLDQRPAPPPQEKRDTMLQPEDIAEIVVFVAALPAHVHIERMIVKSTGQ